MLKRTLFVLLILALAAPAALATDMWLHVRVDEQGSAGESVKVNLPLSLVQAVLPLIDDEHLSGGKIKIDELDLDKIDVAKLLETIDNTPDGDYVTVKDQDEKVRVAKKNGFLLVHVDGGEGEEAEQVRVRIPLDVVRALISETNGELDIMAAIEALGNYDGDIVTVQEKDSSVRIWIDAVQEGA